MVSFTRKYIFLILAVLLVACGDSQPYLLGPQMHDGIEVLVEIRPGAPTVGMNEFLVLATQKNRLPASNYIVSIKMQNTDEWNQSIQDGATGVYRRAIRVNDPSNDVLLVQLSRKHSKQPPAELVFPLTSTAK